MFSDQAKFRLLNCLVAVVVAAVLFSGYRQYQRGASWKYFRSESFTTLARALPQGTNAQERVSISLEKEKVVIRVKVDTQMEFDRLTAVSKRPERPRIERLIILREGVEYHL